MLSFNKRVFVVCKAEASILGGWGSRPPDFGQGWSWEVAEGSGGSWTGREILLQLILYRKYVRSGDFWREI